MSESATPEPGPLSVDQAMAALMPPVEEAAPEAPVEAAAEPDEIEGEASAPEDAEGEAETPAEVEETDAEPEAVEPVDPPKYWSQDAKAQFAALPSELQAVVLAQEGPREEAAAKVKAEAAAERQTAQAEIAKVAQLAEKLGEFLPQALETFQSRWGSDPDWVAYATEHGAEAMMIAKVQHETELNQLQRLAVAKQEAESQAHQAYVAGEFGKLAELAPELVDPEKGGERRAKVAKYLEAAGIAPEAIRQISAVEMSLAHDGIKWREAQAALKVRPPPAKPASAPAVRSPVRPAAAAAQSSQRSALQQAQSRFNLDPSADNAAALMLARG